MCNPNEFEKCFKQKFEMNCNVYYNDKSVKESNFNMENMGSNTNDMTNDINVSIEAADLWLMAIVGSIALLLGILLGITITNCCNTCCSKRKRNRNSEFKAGTMNNNKV